MFGTYDVNEAFLPKGFEAEGQRIWRSCELVVHAPWFMVEYLEQIEGWSQKSVVFIHTDGQLLSLYQNPDIQITEVHVMTPPSLNETSSWQMYKVKHVMQASHMNDPNQTSVTIYVTLEGRKLQYYANGKRKRTKLHNFMTIYADFPKQNLPTRIMNGI